MGKWSPAVGLGQQGGGRGGVSSHLTALWAQRPSCPRCDPQPYTASPSSPSPCLSPSPNPGARLTPCPRCDAIKTLPSPEKPLQEEPRVSPPAAPDPAEPSVLGYHCPPLPPPFPGPAARNKSAPPTPFTLYPLRAALRQATARWRSGPAHRPAGGAHRGGGGEWEAGGGKRGVLRAG